MTDEERQEEIQRQLAIHRKLTEAGAFSLFVPSAFQRPWFQSEKKITTVIKGNQVGGTTCAVVRMLTACLGTAPLSMGGIAPPDWGQIKIREKPGMYLFMSQSFTKTVPEVLMPKFREFISPAMLSRKPKRHATGVPYIFYFKSGAELHLGTYDQPAEAFEGPLWNGINFDEPPPRDIYVACRRGTMRTNGWMMFTMTPLKELWVYDELHLPAQQGKVDDVAPFEAHSHLNCVLDGTVIDGRITGGLKARYSGECREIETKSGNRVAVTIQHPVLTTRGIVRASDLRKGDHVLCQVAEVRRSGLSVGQVQNDYAGESVAGEVFDLLRRQGEVKSQRAAVDLDGDERSFDRDDVHLVGFLAQELREVPGMRNWEVTPVEHLGERDLIVADGIRTAFLAGAQASATTGSPGFAEGAFDVCPIATALSPQESSCFGLVAKLDAPLPKEALQSVQVAVNFCGELAQRFPGLVAPDEIVEIRDFHYSGHVYDFSTDVGYFASNNLLSRNCRQCNPHEGHIEHKELESFFQSLTPNERRAREMGIPLDITDIRFYYVQRETHVVADIW